MDVNGVHVPDQHLKSLGLYYKGLIEQAATAAGHLGMNRESREYLVALSLITACTATVEKAYGFDSIKRAHEFLKKISS